jgi:hypothetical protein
MKLGSALALGFVLVGCTAPRTDFSGCPGLKAPHAKATVVVIPSRAAAPFNYVTPMEKQDALDQGLYEGLLVAAEPGGAFVLPLTMSIGAAQGLRGKTPEQIRGAEMVLTNAAAELDLCERLCRHLIDVGPGLTGHTWVLAKAPPAHSGNVRPSRSLPDDQVILLIDLPAFALEPVLESDTVSVNPTLRLRAEARCRIVNAATSEEMGEQTVRFGAGLHKFLTWAQNDAVEFRSQASRGSRVLAEELIRNLFPAQSNSD